MNQEQLRELYEYQMNEEEITSWKEFSDGLFNAYNRKGLSGEYRNELQSIIEPKNNVRNGYRQGAGYFSVDAEDGKYVDLLKAVTEEKEKAEFYFFQIIARRISERVENEHINRLSKKNINTSNYNSEASRHMYEKKMLSDVFGIKFYNEMMGKPTIRNNPNNSRQGNGIDKKQRNLLIVLIIVAGFGFSLFQVYNLLTDDYFSSIIDYVKPEKPIASQRLESDDIVMITVYTLDVKVVEVDGQKQLVKHDEVLLSVDATDDITLRKSRFVIVRRGEWFTLYDLSTFTEDDESYYSITSIEDEDGYILADILDAGDESYEMDLYGDKWLTTK